MAKLGYIRVSSTDQNPDRQRDALHALGIEDNDIFEDKRSGKDTSRPALQKLMAYARKGDTIYFESISRLARNTRDFLAIMDMLAEKGVAVVSLKEPIDTTTPAGRLILTIFAALAEMEREYIRERQREGQAAARARGKSTGRPAIKYPPGWKEEVFAWRLGRQTAADTWRKLGLTKTTFYKLARQDIYDTFKNGESGGS